MKKPTAKDHSVLIVEDDPLLLSLMADACEERGLRVMLARNGAEAVTAIIRSVPDIMLVDILMPEMDGYGLLQQIADRKWYFPIVVFSNLGDDASRARCAQLGAAEYIVKSDSDADGIVDVLCRHLKNCT